MALKREKISKSINPQKGGYLFCTHCGGCYKLKKGESPRDFVKCECGNPLDFCKTKEELDSMIHSFNRNKELFNLFETRVLERRENLKDLFPKMDIDIDFINDTEEEELWDVLDRKAIIDSQKKYLDTILEEERLMDSIGEKKVRIKNPTLIDGITSFYEQVDPLIILGGVIIILLILAVLIIS